MSGFQGFDDPAGGHDHPARLTALRARLAEHELDGFIVPRADAHQGEYVAEADARLAWLTGFTGSAGFAVITQNNAGVFIDGRYRVQVKAQVDLAHFTPVAWPENKPADWLRDAIPEGGRIGFDPWLHSRHEISALEAGLEGSGVELVAFWDNPVDAIWPDRPAPPAGLARLHPISHAGETAQDKRHRLAAQLHAAGQSAAVLTLPDSISWLLNIRGSDIDRNPVVQSFALLGAQGQMDLFADARKFPAELRDALGNEVSIHDPGQFRPALLKQTGPVRVDPATAPEAIFLMLNAADIPVIAADDPAIGPKARKNPAELAGMRAAHLRDGAAMVRLLAWLDSTAPGGLTEIDVVRKLESFRREHGITDISFDTICGAGPNGAIVHYRVTQASDRRLAEGELLLIDSGGQYPDGTTDITRTVPLGVVPADAIAPYTAVLRGMIALSMSRFPKGVTGAHLDALARQFLWQQGLDYDHGTGHGVGAALCVHEGPARISRSGEIPIESGMILSNEPGYYRESAFGIRIENLVVVGEVEGEPGRTMLGFETLTLCPIDLRPVDRSVLSSQEISWINQYHANVRAQLAPLVDGAAQDWLIRATDPI